MDTHGSEEGSVLTLGNDWESNGCGKLGWDGLRSIRNTDMTFTDAFANR